MGRRALAGLAVVAIVGTGIAAVATRADAADIFEVDLKHCDTLHVGYKNFPAQTVIRWTVSQHGAVVATGQFVTAAGPGFHFYDATLATALDPHPKASVTFVATIDGREFRMTAGRAAANPNKTLCVKTRVASSGGPTPVRLTAAAKRTTTHTANPPIRALAFTGNSPRALVGVGFVLMGAAFLVIARPPSRRAKTRHRRRPAPWLYITPVP